MTRTLFLALAISCLLSPAARGQPDIDLRPITERHEMIPMRDGNRLSAYLYFPPGSGPWPAVFEQRYADLRGAGTRRAAAKLAEAGYVVAFVNFRGTHLSEGTWVGYRALGWGELKDGYDTCEWLAKQQWCTGSVGTFGSSQGGYAQNFLAVTQPPHLKCQYMVDTGLSLFQEGYRIGGTTRPQRFLAMASNCRNPDDNRRLLEEWFRHPNYDDYWRDEDCSLHFDKMNVPCFTIGSWYDFMNQGSIASFIGRQHHGGPNSRGRQQLLIGPWLHGGQKSNRIGELVYPENAAWPSADHMVRWFDHYLKDNDNGIERDPAVRYYVMGAVGEPNATGNVWRTANDWPPLNKATSYFLRSSGGLSTQRPTDDEGETRYTSDPLHPMQIPGTAFPGAKDARSFEQQADVRTFTTAPLEEPVEWTGRVRAELYVQSTALDTDFIARISDVYPDGRSILICDYPWRARYREGFDHEVLLPRFAVGRLVFDVGWISQVFSRGHRIRVTIASSGAPLYEPNPQAGGPLTIDFPKDAVKAENAIAHNRGFASRIIAPVISEAAAQDARVKSAVRYIESEAVAAASAAVIVDDVSLVQTTQVGEADDLEAASSDLDTHLHFLFGHLEDALQDAGSDLDKVVRLNFCIKPEPGSYEAVRKAIAARFAAARQPAVTIAIGPPRIDAIALTSKQPVPAVVQRRAKAAVMPPGNRIYVSGQAERGVSLREATRLTLEKLSATLKHCGRDDRDVFQVKCFLNQELSRAIVREEVARHFGGDGPPPVTIVPWDSPLIEIELVAWGGPVNHEAKEALEFITPPGMTASPVFSRVARIHRGGTIFMSDIYGPEDRGAEEQVIAAFERLKQLCTKTGTDLKNLVKATYFVADDETSRFHNSLRTRYFDAQRPPAASKALVKFGTGHGHAKYSMDMIAVPSSRGTPVTGPENGFGLKSEDAAAGWISLFDGSTTFGWKDAEVKDALLRGGTTTTSFGKCQVRGEIVGSGMISIGGREIAVSSDKPLAIEATAGSGPIRIGSGVALKSLSVRPLDLKPLFNGSDMTGWKTIVRSGPTGMPSAFWRVESGVLRAVGGPGAIEHDGPMYGDFALQIDVRSRAVHSNGGVFFRSVPGQLMNGYEAQLHNKCLDDDPAKPSRYCTGGIDDRQDARRMISRDFEPFRMTVIATGPHIATWINGYQTADWTDERPTHENPRQGQRLAAGTIQLQAHDPATDYEVRQLLIAPW